MGAISCSSKGRAGGGADGVRRRPARALGLRRWLDRERGLGQRLSVRELVIELHVRRGLSLGEVARLLGISLRVARGHLPPRGGVEPLCAPQSEADFAGLRELVGVTLWQTVAETFAPEETLEGDAKKSKASAAARKRRRPGLMSTRIRALKQIAKLYGVRGKGRVRDSEVAAVPCATPEEIAEAVGKRRRELKV